MPPFTSTTARKARCRKAGLASARFWRSWDFANLKRAREQRSLNAARRRAERLEWEEAQRHTLILPHGRAFVWYCTCGLTGHGEKTAIPLHRVALGLDSVMLGTHIVTVPTAQLGIDGAD